MERLEVKYLHAEHEVVKAGKMMVHSHANHETLVPAIEEVKEAFPDVSNEVIIALWIGVNAKNRGGE